MFAVVSVVSRAAASSLSAPVLLRDVAASMFMRTVLAPSATLFDLYKARKELTGDALWSPTKRAVVEDVSAEQYINTITRILCSVPTRTCCYLTIFRLFPKTNWDSLTM